MLKLNVTISECNLASTEAELANKIANLDDNVAQRTKDDEFNPFRYHKSAYF